jgi:CheY-like chemotaxis protein
VGYPVEKLRVLVVDDNGLLGASLVRILSRSGYTARHVLTSEEAAATATVEAFDCGVFDICLGREDGVRVAAELLEARRIGAAVFFSATCRKLDRDRANRLGVFVSKEGSVQGLLGAIVAASSKTGPRSQ